QREAADLRAVALLASAAAHEINNPLTVVVGSLELLARHLGSDQQERRWLDRANAAAQRIRDIVARMTRITRIERTDARPGRTAGTSAYRAKSFTWTRRNRNGSSGRRITAGRRAATSSRVTVG